MRRKIGSTHRRRKAAPRRKTTTRRRRRISGIGKIDAGGLLMKAAALGAGAIAGRELKTLLIKILPSMSPMIVNVAGIGIGGILPMFVKNNKFVADMADGIMANGVMELVVSTGIIKGIGNDGSMMTYRINGSPRLRTIAGGGSLSAIAGGGSLSAIAGNALPGGSRVRATANAKPQLY